MTNRIDIDREDFQAVTKDDQRAFERLFRKYYKVLCDYARGIVGRQEQAEDLVQDVLGYFWIKRQEIVIEISVRAYLYSAVRHAALNALRKQSTEQKHRPLLTEFIEYLEQTEYTEEECEDIEAMRHLLKSLPQQCLKVFLMSCLENKKYQQIADELGITVNTVKTHISKAYRMIREKTKGNLPLVLWLIVVEKSVKRARGIIFNL